MTSVVLQPPYTGSGDQPPVVDVFQLLYEPEDGEIGALEVYSDAAGLQVRIDGKIVLSQEEKEGIFGTFCQRFISELLWAVFLLPWYGK